MNLLHLWIDAVVNAKRSAFQAEADKVTVLAQVTTNSHILDYALATLTTLVASLKAGKTKLLHRAVKTVAHQYSLWLIHLLQHKRMNYWYTSKGPQLSWKKTENGTLLCEL